MMRSRHGFATVFILASALFASGAQADTYQGVTLGEPIPETISPRLSERFADSARADRLPDALRDLCEHSLHPLGPGAITVVSDRCDGPVVSVSTTAYLESFFDRDNDAPPVTTDLDMLTFKETTLAEVRARFCSEGLIAPPFFGQAEPDLVRALAFAYELERSDTVAVFWFQLPRSLPWALTADAPPPPDPALRDTAVLVGIDLMTSDYFNQIIQDSPVPSAGYVPIPDIFDTNAGATAITGCPFS